MNDTDLALWLQGAAAMIGDRLPTEFEWKAITEKVDAVVGQRVANRLAWYPPVFPTYTPPQPPHALPAYPTFTYTAGGWKLG